MTSISYLLFNQQLCVLCVALSAVREDRTPGGKHRVKKLRADGVSVAEHLSFKQDSATVGNTCSEEDEVFIQQLVDSKPDLIPGPPGSCLELETNNGIGIVERSYVF